MKLALNWFEIPTENFERAKGFYENLFNFKMQVLINEASFKMGLLSSEKSAAGAIVWHPDFYKPSSAEGVLIYFDGNPDLIEVLNRVESAGGKILIRKNPCLLKKAMTPEHDSNDCKRGWRYKPARYPLPETSTHLSDQ